MDQGQVTGGYFKCFVVSKLDWDFSHSWTLRACTSPGLNCLSRTLNDCVIQACKRGEFKIDDFWNILPVLFFPAMHN